MLSLVRTGIFDIFDAERIAKLPRDYVIRNAVTQAKALDGSRSLAGSHVCKIIEVHSGNRFGCMEPFQIVSGTSMNLWPFSIWLHLRMIR
jgi:hypothetical protein